MKITKKQLRRIIKEEVAKNERRSVPAGYEKVAQSIQEKAQQVGDGIIIDLSSMESSGGGLYSSYQVAGGKATLDVRHIGNLAYALSEAAKEQNPIMIGGKAIHIFPNDEEWSVMNDDY
jgi:hypothetical protein